MSAAPAAFDPAVYIADMCAVGAVLTPYTITSRSAAGQRVFSIAGERCGVPGAVIAVAEQHEAAARAHPDWMAAVHDTLIAKRRAAS